MTTDNDAQEVIVKTVGRPLFTAISVIVSDRRLRVIVKIVGRPLFTWAVVVLLVSGGEVFAQGAGVIAGQVTEGRDCPRPGVRIEAVGEVGGEVRRFGVSDRDGRFRIDGLPEGVYAVFPDLDAFRERERRRVDPRRERPVDFQLDHTLYGTVTLDGQRVGGRTVFVQLDNCEAEPCRCASGRRNGVTRQDDGTYRIEDLPAGAYRVSIVGEDVHALDASVVLEDRKWHSNEIALTSAPGPVPPDRRSRRLKWAK